MPSQHDHTAQEGEAVTRDFAGSVSAEDAVIESAPSDQQPPQEGQAPQDEQDTDMYGYRHRGAAAAGGGGFMGGISGFQGSFVADYLSRFVADPPGFLSAVASQKPSPGGLAQVAGQVANQVHQMCQQHLRQGQTSSIPDSNSPEGIAFLYLRAAGRQLVSGAGATQTQAAPPHPTNHRNEVLLAVRSAAEVLKNLSGMIARSGILASLAHCIGSQSNKTEPPLTPVHVEFLQCCLLAGQYRFAERISAGTWPKPESPAGGAEQVIRYYMLRGVLCIKCEQWELAHRCFWACLSVPADSCSPFAIMAWKKLILVQCILHEQDKLQGQSTPLANGLGGASPREGRPSTYTAGITVPQSIPECIAQLLNRYRNPKMSSSTPPKQPKQSKQSSRGSSRHGGPPHLTHHTAPPRGPDPPSEENPIAPYMDIAKAFIACESSTFERLTNENTQTLVADDNTGLIQECAMRLRFFQLARISRIYLVLPLAKLSQLIGVEEAMIAPFLCKSGVPCEIQEDGMVVFPDFALSYASRPSQGGSKSISFETLDNWSDLMVRVQKLDAAVASSAKYQAAIRKDSLTSNPGGPRGVDDI